ncbi:MAG: AtpZ/AtpI family protein [Acidimicrobiales bacterium]
METTGRTDRGSVTNAIARLVPRTAPPADVDADAAEVADPHAERRALTNGFGDALAKAFELAATPAVFGFLGWLLDRWLGTAPIFLLALVVIVFLYEVWKLADGYTRTMAEHEARLLGHTKNDGPA